VYEQIVHDDASDDLERILEHDYPAGVALVALLEELENNQDLMDRLTQHGFGGRPAQPKPRTAVFNVSKWIEAQTKDMNLWRVRGFDDECSRYRCIYAYQPLIDRYIILGIGRKVDKATTIEEFDYELDSDLSRRIQAAYRRLMED